MVQVNNYLHFNGNCRLAMEFYKGVFGGDLEIQTIGESPMAAHMPPESHKNVMHSTLRGGKVVLMGSDMMDASQLGRGNISLTLVSDNANELKELFAKLSVGGKVGQELKVEFFGTYGDLVDQFGIPWMFQSDAKS